MSSIQSRQKSEIEAQPMHRIARVPIHLTPSRVRWLLGIMLLADCALIALFLASTLPEVQSLTKAGRLASLDLTVPANLPWTWYVLKFYGLAAVCGLMSLSYSGGQRPDVFWRIGAALALFLAIAESTRLHEIWAASLAPALFGAGADPQVSLLISRGAPILLFFLASLSLFPARSRAAFVSLLSSIALFALAAMGPPIALVSAGFGPLAPGSIEIAWSNGLNLLGQSLMLGAIWFGIRDIQAVSVRYVYRG